MALDGAEPVRASILRTAGGAPGLSNCCASGTSI